MYRARLVAAVVGRFPLTRVCLIRKSDPLSQNACRNWHSCVTQWHRAKAPTQLCFFALFFFAKKKEVCRASFVLFVQPSGHLHVGAWSVGEQNIAPTATFLVLNAFRDHGAFHHKKLHAADLLVGGGGGGSGVGGRADCGGKNTLTLPLPLHFSTQQGTLFGKEIPASSH